MTKFEISVESDSIDAADMIDVLTRGGLKRDAISVADTAQNRDETNADN